jgi:maltooligosyltrehalose trehalohydrolase
VNPRRFGPIPNGADGGKTTRFRLWAPDAPCPPLLVLGDGDRVAMTEQREGWFEAVIEAAAGTPYRYAFGESHVPDPASRRQDGGAQGWSVVTDLGGFAWKHDDWRGRPWEETVFYELHPGLFGGFAGIAKELPRLAALGITAIELMPIADFPGARNWGYDGVLPFAPDDAYGAPEALQTLVDAAHGLGLMVFLDVVYNHFGPEGNYLPLYAKRFFRDDTRTPWGGAIDFRQEDVRRFFIENALQWICDYRFDGLRFDAVHAIQGRDFLHDLAHEVRAAAGERHMHLVVENEKNEASLLNDFDAQWNDDIHHVLHVLLTGETEGYYADFAEAPAQKLARALTQGFVYQGEYSPHQGAARGEPSGHLPPTAFVSFLQNHDQIGNRAFGERLTVLADPAALRAAAALLLLAPQIPLIFMGEEMGATTPFLYFTDYTDAEVAAAVREGRRTEFAKFPAFSNEEVRAKIPDPNDSTTFEKSSLPRGNHDTKFHRDLLALRAQHIVPRLKGAKAGEGRAVGPKAVLVRWRMGDGAQLTLAANFGDAAVTADLPAIAPLFGRSEGSAIPGCSTLCWLAP